MVEGSPTGVVWLYAVLCLLEHQARVTLAVVRLGAEGKEAEPNQGFTASPRSERVCVAGS